MPKKDHEISQQDCPAVPAPQYPGIYSKDNPNGSLLTKQDFILSAVKAWVDHFKESEKYESTRLSMKVLYLMRHLKHHKTKRLTQKVVQAMIVKAEILLGVSSQRERGDNSLEVGEKEVNEELIDGQEDAVDEAMEEENIEAAIMDIEEEGNIQIEENPPKQVDDDNETVGSESDIDSDDEESSSSSDEDENNGKKRYEQELEIKKWLVMSDNELFEMDNDIPNVVKKCRRYVKRKNDFVKNYIESMDYQNSQEVLESYSQNPNIVKTSKNLKRKLEHLTYEERATKLVLKSVSNSIAQLRKCPGSGAKNQVKEAVALISHHRWGTPKLDEKVSWRLKKEAKEMKINLLTGKETLLTPPPKKKRKVVPDEVKEKADKHWQETTIPEPSVHRRMKKKEKQRNNIDANSAETVPIRWQHLSNKEQYRNFKEEYSVEVSEIMRKYGEENIRKLEERVDSDDKQRRLEMYGNMQNNFPSESWYHDQKPPEVKPLCDHTTGLCRICEAASLNFITLKKHLKRLCVCKTNSCPDWVCFCNPEEDDSCSCQCACDSCTQCEVCSIRGYLWLPKE